MGWIFLGIIATLFGIGFFVDWSYKKRGIHDFDPEENAKHVSGYDKAYLEAHSSQVKDDHNNGGF
ncbi:hypothetical protein LS684_11640 [Cytobacillus spongiae]|jgi:hypothetical protein|uniref:hypothetical protein n=1 Tax=Cytobacillus spongiae TaxID=2901381 RepID=UPI001F3C2A2B|nr:hypothetical protein [Cytobacillus spongiae]UII54338.1 hypothetical protein LS684_11640 [Cytobacillus spongiae]